MSEEPKPKKQKLYFVQTHQQRQEELEQFCKEALIIQTQKIEDFEDSIILSMKRFEEFKFLKEVFQYQCKKMNIKFIPSAIPRWCLTKKLLEEKGDPLIPNPKDEFDSALYHELINYKTNEKDAKQILSKITQESKASFINLQKCKNEKTEKVLIKKLEDEAIISCGNIKFNINKIHYDKLEKLYYKNSTESEKFNDRLYLLLSRYNTLSAVGYQGGIPKKLFQYLSENFQLTHECFASPLNCTLDSYCSAFYDVDKYFGSKGSFFKYEILEGFYEANPPFIEEIMVMMSMRIIELLDQSKKELGFFIVLPAWEDTLTYSTLSESKYLQHLLKFESGKHIYVDGAQHKVKIQERLSEAPSFVFILQNDLGKEKWKFDEKAIEMITKNFQQ